MQTKVARVWSLLRGETCQFWFWGWGSVACRLADFARQLWNTLSPPARSRCYSAASPKLRYISPTFPQTSCANRVYKTVVAQCVAKCYVVAKLCSVSSIRQQSVRSVPNNLEFTAICKSVSRPRIQLSTRLHRWQGHIDPLSYSYISTHGGRQVVFDTLVSCVL